jgi:hypothetical protein
MGIINAKNGRVKRAETFFNKYIGFESLALDGRGEGARKYVNVKLRRRKLDRIFSAKVVVTYFSGREEGYSYLNYLYSIINFQPPTICPWFLLVGYLEDLLSTVMQSCRWQINRRN